MKEKYPIIHPTKPRYWTKKTDVAVCGVFGMSVKNAEFLCKVVATRLSVQTLH